MRWYLFLLLVGCTSSNVYTVVSESPITETITIKERQLSTEEAVKYLPKKLESDRKPDVVSVRANLSDYYPETKSNLYRVKTDNLRIRDFPSSTGQVVGVLNKDQVVLGNEIEGNYIRIFKNSYVGIKYLEKVDK